MYFPQRGDALLIAMGKNIRKSEKSQILRAIWPEKYVNIFMMKERETKHFQTYFTPNILKIIKIDLKLNF